MDKLNKAKRTSMRRVEVQRVSVASAKPFEAVLGKLEAAIGRPQMDAFRQDVVAAKTHTELERVVHKAIGVSGFMEFARYEMGEILRKESGGSSRRILRLVIGNPLIMSQMVAQVPDAASYAPVTVLIDERARGVRLSYDRMSSLLAPYESAEALKVAQDLDSKVEALLTAVSQ